ncbi:MAG: excinuclease ABC subunit UvrC, partial [Oscillospiraceae bacterium]|nr:excinuclease ABC subunit UvrC [Oscillospiraceae bacterium]
METIEALNKKALMLPQLPGVYLMRGKKGVVIYVGKAKRLRNRVVSYFREGALHEDKVARMVAVTEDFDFIVTDSEFEALVLECSLIKQHLPKYNILMKDDRGFSYIRISDERYPRIAAVYRTHEDGARYIGPYLGTYGARKMVETATQVFGIPTCGKSFPKDIGKDRPCLNFHIGKCMGLCGGQITHEEYTESVDGAVTLLTKGAKEILGILRRDMQYASEALEFEKAARLRDSITAIERIDEKQKIIRSKNHADADVFAFAADERNTSAVVLKFREGVLADKDEEALFGTTDIAGAREEFITHYYILGKEIPKLIFTDEPLESEEPLARMLSDLRGNHVTITSPQRGDNRALVNMAYSNAVECLNLKAGRRNRD